MKTPAEKCAERICKEVGIDKVSDGLIAAIIQSEYAAVSVASAINRAVDNFTDFLYPQVKLTDYHRQQLCVEVRNAVEVSLAGIEQENQRLKEQVTATQDLYKEACRHVLEFRQENQRLREALSEIANCDEGDDNCASPQIMVIRIKSFAQQALATDTKGGG